MSHRLRTSALVVMLAASPMLVVPARAMGQEGPQRGLPDQMDEMRPGEIQRLFDAYVVMQAQEMLGLSDPQFPPFLSRLKALQETRRRNQQARGQIMQELNRMTNPRAPNPLSADEGTVRERLKALQELESRSAAELRRAYDALDQVLDVKQQARFRVFEEQMERRKLELLLRARQANRPRARPQ